MPHTEESMSPDVLGVRAAQQRLLVAVQNENADAYVACFAEDGMLMPPNQKMVRGRPAIREWIGTLFQQFHVHVELSAQELHIAKDLAVDRHDYVTSATPKRGGPAVTERGKGLNIFRRAADGSWKVYIDCWNSDTLQTPQ